MCLNCKYKDICKYYDQLESRVHPIIYSELYEQLMSHCLYITKCTNKKCRDECEKTVKNVLDCIFKTILDFASDICGYKRL